MSTEWNVESYYINLTSLRYQLEFLLMTHNRHGSILSTCISVQSSVFVLSPCIFHACRPHLCSRVHIMLNWILSNMRKVWFKYDQKPLYVTTSQSGDAGKGNIRTYYETYIHTRLIRNKDRPSGIETPHPIILVFSMIRTQLDFWRGNYSDKS